MNGMGEILVVEDTPASLKLLSDLLGNAGYLVRQAPDGELALWSASARPPELVLLDVNMPGIDGFEVCRRLKADPALCDIPVIFLSAQYEMDDKVRGFQCGAVDFIAKPYQTEEVLARAQAHIRLARTQKALKETLEELRSARAEVARNERMAALGALVAGVAHELNTPLGNSVLLASTLEDRARAFGSQIGEGVRRSDLETFAADTAKAAGLLLRSLYKTSELVESFKQVAVDQSQERRTRFELGQLVTQALQPMKASLAEQGIDLEVELPPALEMDSYARAVAHILQQLVRNAQVHAFGEIGSAGGVLRVHAAQLDGEQVRIEVHDNGCGIAPDTQQRIFDPFFTTRMGTGTGGLGLHVVHNLLSHVLGGQVSVDSKPGATCFCITLPLTAPALSP
ncbi:hybrid sensor histidine kinase/response regulator [Pseudoduganella sp. OTU4001]|uniref:hybrid sensor histidine kinase/response regulator n=1 Tax=Pseudoduganella sp. OTU4001 TaxID=3043854 RepID=UPI00313DEC89